jgi:hypothetical protein
VTRDVVHTASSVCPLSAFATSPVTPPRVIYTSFPLIPTSVVLLLLSHAWHLNRSTYFVSSLVHLITNCVRSQVSSSLLLPLFILFSNNALIHPCLPLRYSPFFTFHSYCTEKCLPTISGLYL